MQLHYCFFVPLFLDLSLRYNIIQCRIGGLDVQEAVKDIHIHRNIYELSIPSAPT
jgi:hypothetical protein